MSWTERTKEILTPVKDGLTVIRDLMFLLLFAFLLFFPQTLNDLLSKAGITALNGGIFTWKQQVQVAAAKTKDAADANQATAASLDDVKTVLGAISSQSGDAKIKAQADDAIQKLDSSLSTLNYAGSNLRSSLATQQTILQATAPTQASSTNNPLQGWVYLGEADAERKHWITPPQPKVAASTPIPTAGQSITLTDDLYLRADKASGQTFNQAVIVGVAHVGSTAKVLEVQPSHALNGGDFIWAKIIVQTSANDKP